MRAFLFLYPTIHYVCHERERLNIETSNGTAVAQLNRMIDCRYRQQKYQVFWLTFGHSSNPLRPDRESISPEISIYPDDRIISAGVRFYPHESFREFEYANPDFILEQMEQTPEFVFLGGFHQGDCVDKMGAALHQRGIPVIVDEHLTDRYFILLSRGVVIPDVCEPSIESFHPPIPHFDSYREMVVENRRNKPWFVQP